MKLKMFRRVLLTVLLIVLPMIFIPPLLSTRSASALPDGLTPHDSIHIDGNGDFTLANGVVGGSGTAGDPYLIENWVISGIEIMDTDAYFVIRNCLVEGSSSYVGIHLDNVKNGRAENCTLEGKYIRLYSSSNNTLVNNTCFGGDISLYSSPATLINNACFGGGIYARDSPSSRLENNTCSNNIGDGIFLDHYSDFSTLKNNTCSNNRGWGIRVEYSTGCRIENNTCSNNEKGGILMSWVFPSPYSLSNNICSGNRSMGIYLTSAPNGHLTNNTCSNNGSDGIYLFCASGSTIKSNTCSNNEDDGMRLRSTARSIFENNTFLKNNVGISLDEDSEQNHIYHNNFINNLAQVRFRRYFGKYGREPYSTYWDDGYPSGGNYWSDYPGTDKYRGENQDISGSDGIGDTPYVLGSHNQDRYPLMQEVVGGPRQYNLITSVKPPGAGTVSGGGAYDEGASVTLIALANLGYEFDHWSGDATGTNPSTTITVDSDKSVTAHFMSVLGILVVPTRFPDEDTEEFNEKTDDFNEKLGYVSSYFFEQSFNTDSIEWTFAEPIEMPEESGKYPDVPGDRSYTPKAKYLNDVWDILEEDGYELSDYDALLTYQTCAASRANGFGEAFRAATCLPGFLPPGMEEFFGVYKGEIPAAMVTFDERNEVIAHELGHALYGFDDFYPEKRLGLQMNRGNIDGWGLMGGPLPEEGPEIYQPIFSLNKVEVGWLEREDTIVYHSKEFEIHPLEEMDLGDNVIQILELNLGLPYIYKFIIEARENTPFELMGLSNPFGVERGVVIYQEAPIILPPKVFWEKLEAPRVDYFQPTLFENTDPEGKNQKTYRHPPTGLVFSYEGYDKDSHKFKIRVDRDLPIWMSGVVLRSIPPVAVLGVQSSKGESFPGLDLHAYTKDGFHIGMNYETGEYEVEIPGAMASGPQTVEEWIFVPRNIEVSFEVNSTRASEFLENLGMSVEEPLQYSFHMIKYGKNPSAEVVENKVVVKDVSYSKVTTDNIVLGKTIELMYLAPEPTEGTSWTLIIGVVATIVIITGILVYARRRACPRTEEGRRSRGCSMNTWSF